MAAAGLICSGVRPSAAQLHTPCRRTAALKAHVQHACSGHCVCGRRSRKFSVQTYAAASDNNSLLLIKKDDVEVSYLTKRASHVTKWFEGALGVDDFMQRVEISLWNHGFQNDNSIACVNLCRDESTLILKHKLDQVFGSSFSINGLGGVITCGVTGVGAGLSHSPLCETSGKERYVFFSFPHIGIDSKGVVGNISRPGRATMSCACGALIKGMSDLKNEGLDCNCFEPGVHEPLNVEYSILKQRLARKLQSEGQTDESVKSLDLVDITKAAERTITDDLEFLISKAVDINKADYAVVTGVQIHNWAQEFDGGEPNLEFVWPTKMYVVVNGERTDIDISAMPGLTPRQIRLLAAAPDAHVPPPGSADDAVCNTAGTSTLREIDPPYMFSTRQARRKVNKRLAGFARVEAGGVMSADSSDDEASMDDIIDTIMIAAH